jgi:hypothetical protein
MLGFDADARVRTIPKTVAQHYTIWQFSFSDVRKGPDRKRPG